MGARRDRSPLTAEQEDDARRLKARWEAFRLLSTKLKTQTDLAEATGLGTQGLISQYLNGWIALNTDAVLSFSKVLECDPEEISPTLAAKLPPRTVMEPTAVYSTAARTVADFIDRQPPESRPRIALIIQMLLSNAVSDDDVLKASEHWESPKARARKNGNTTKRGKE